MTANRSKMFFWLLVVMLAATCLASIFIFRPIIDGDGLTYVEAIKVLQGGTVPTNFVPNRLLSTWLGLESIILFSKIFGTIEYGWLILNILFYFIFNLIFYQLVRQLFKSAQVAFLASLFLATNYAAISFGLDYWLDIGGWTFYVISLYLTLKYAQTGEKKALLYSALAIGIGGLFKEYAFLGVVPIALIISYQNWPKISVIVKKAIAPALLVIGPLLIVSVWVFQKFNYTYANWLSMNQAHYVYASRLVEYVKSLGSLYTVLALLVIGGGYYLIRQSRELVPDKINRSFILAVILSIVPVFFWPAITERILFITVPAMLLVASFMFKRRERYWPVFLLILALYVIINFAMDSFILPNFNLPF